MPPVGRYAQDQVKDEEESHDGTLPTADPTNLATREDEHPPKKE
ncbi:MAG: hypothetical protein OSB65_01925 [Roseibacillus sp.]|nr:hypothetical protein [Roseibacillus sp.]